ncbi:hypothetical protein [Lysobacter brunescens]|uniref:Phage protein n=1 Tax=Lysobacter brunescens TaxID=262323 RepID=A0ABW2YJD6_9GAMM
MNSFDKFLAICVICAASMLGGFFIGWSALAFGAAGIGFVALAKESGSHE